MADAAGGPDDRDGAETLDRVRRQRFAAHITATLDARGLRYAVLRDPRRLFEEGRGDLDLWAPSENIATIERLVLAEAMAAGWWMIKRVRRPYVTSLYLYAPGSPPAALTIDLFPAIRWIFADLIAEEELSRARRRDQGVWLIDPAVSVLASCLHHLAWNGPVPARYLEAFRSSVPVDLPYAGIIRGLARDPDPDWASSRRDLLASATMDALGRHPLRSVAIACSTVLSLIRSPRGRWVNLEGDQGRRCLEHIDRQLHEEHFLVGRWGSVGEIPTGGVHRALWNLLVLGKRRLGAVMLSAGSHRVVGPDLRISDPGHPSAGDDPRAGTSPPPCSDLAGYVVAWLATELRVPVERGR
jgi:hypothetical protein